ncbi:MAG: hypothetical protein R3185_09785 [Candidatus Thermoplasmatota archaeon]|nr:hypothetical protein [Candidatus Thermoplasmatota archaeon]
MTTTTSDEKQLGVFIRERQKDLSVRKSIKVKLPIRQHIKLHALKLFGENNISETVEIALDEYFERLGDDDPQPDVAGASA